MKTCVRMTGLLVLAVLCHPALELVYAEPEAVVEEEEGAEKIEEAHLSQWSQVGVSPMTWPVMGVFLSFQGLLGRFPGLWPV